MDAFEDGYSFSGSSNDELSGNVNISVFNETNFNKNMNVELSFNESNTEISRNLKYKNFRNHTSIIELLNEKNQYMDIKLKAQHNSQVLYANRVVLAASSPFLMHCVTDADEESLLTITDCCFESLSLAVHYIYKGYFETRNIALMNKTKDLIERLKIGDFSIKTSIEEPLIKIEPSAKENNSVNSYYTFLNTMNDTNDMNGGAARSINVQDEWKDDVISSLYKEDDNDTVINNDKDDEILDGDPFVDDDEEEYTIKQINIKHTKKKKCSRKIPCKECDKKFRLPEQLENHIMKKHNKGTFKCEHCPKTFKKAGQRKLHEEIHSKPYKCDQCDASFARKSNLLGHMR